MALRRSPLEDEHRSLGAKLGEFGGWAMPIEYEGVLGEHRAVREAAGMFDLSHLGKIDVEGAGAVEWLQSVLSNDVARTGTGVAQYSLILNDAGGITDDVIAYRVAAERVLLVPNAANVDRVLRAVEAETRRDVTVTRRPDLATIAVQGPRSPQVVSALLREAGDLAYMRCAESSFRDVWVLVARTGYTGEVGFEVFVPESQARQLWRALLEAGRPLGMVPCGLGARDTLRLEMGYPLHGSDISEQRTPLEAGLGWAVAWDSGDFRGREALLDQRSKGVPARLRGLRMEGKLIPRAGYAVTAGGRRIGETTSGTFSPTLRVGIALAYLSPAEAFEPGTRVEVDVRGRTGEAVVTKPPFVEASPR